MGRSGWFASALKTGSASFVLLGALLASEEAHAQSAGAQGKFELPSVHDEADTGTIRPRAPDYRAGHIFLRGGVGLVIPTGYFQSHLSAASVLGLGMGVNALLGVGLSPNSELNVAGTYALMESTESCPGCTGNSLNGNIGLTYHLVEGIAIDPWIRLGMGYRTADYERVKAAPPFFVGGRYQGLDVADLSLGGTFSPIPGLGIGPYVEADLGTYASRPARPDGEETSLRTYAFFQLGAQIELDPASWFIKRKQVTPKIEKSVASAVDSTPDLMLNTGAFADE